jgi:hypothetical protein
MGSRALPRQESPSWIEGRTSIPTSQERHRIEPAMVRPPNGAALRRRETPPLAILLSGQSSITLERRPESVGTRRGDRMIYLHIGRRKTGTTPLQRFLSVNRALLAEQGFNYPRPNHIRGLTTTS